MPSKAPAAKPVKVLGAFQAIAVDVWARGQDADLRALVRVNGAALLRIRIHVDRSYAFQGHAAVELWADNAWVNVHSRPGQLLTASRGDVNPGFFEDDVRELLTVSLEILDIYVKVGTAWLVAE